MGKVVALVDSGASRSAIRLNTANKLGKIALEVWRGKFNIRGVDNKLVSVDSFYSLIIDWEGNKTELSDVAAIKSSPFSLILSVD